MEYNIMNIHVNTVDLGNRILNRESTSGYHLSHRAQLATHLNLVQQVLE